MSLFTRPSRKSDEALQEKTAERIGVDHGEENAAGRRNANNDDPQVNVDGTCTALPYSVKVYLRIKPCLTSVKSWKTEDVYVILNRTTLLAKFPAVDNNIRGSTKCKLKENAKKKYTFTKIFGASTSQVDFFEQSVKSQITDFLLGQSSTIMTYGTANSGKTYTLYGTSKCPGIIPRSIEMIFSAINCTLSPWYKPTNGCLIVNLDEMKRVLEDRKRRKILNSRLTNENHYAEARKSLENSEIEVSQNERGECSGENLYSVWITFAEIYNENVYDLLADDEESRYLPLKLMMGKDGAAYITGLKTVYVTTALEACQIVVAGQSKMSIAATALNSRSSRSHTIFTLKLLRYQKEDAPEDVEVSTLTFCDLAGPARSRRAQDTDKRLAEARNINSSHLVLGRCLKAVWEGQLNKQNVDNILGLFRESKLTRMFQRPLIGREPVTFLLNIDLSPDLYIETQSVLNLCTIARKIEVDRNKDVRKSTLSKPGVQSPNTQSTSDVTTTLSLTQIPENASSIDNDLYRYLQRDKDNAPYEVEALRKESSGKLYRNLESFSQRSSLVVIKDIFPLPHNVYTAEHSVTCREEVDDPNLFPMEIITNALQRCSANDQILLPHQISPQKLPSIEDDNSDFVTKVESIKKLALKREYEIRDELASHYSAVIDDLQTHWSQRTKEILQNLKVVNMRDAATSPHTSEKQSFVQSEDYETLRNEREGLLKEVEMLKLSLLQYERKIREEMADQYTDIIENVENTWRQRAREVEEEGQDLLKWSVDQVQNYYKERIDSLTRNRKRKRTECGDQDDEEISILEALETENAQITSKVVVLRETVKKLRAENELISAKKNECDFELALTKAEVKDIQNLVNSNCDDGVFIKKGGKGDNTPGRSVDRVKAIIDNKVETIATLRRDLQETRSNYLEASSLTTEMQRKLSSINAMFQGSQKEIEDLKKCLEERMHIVMALQMQLNVREKQLTEARQIIDNAKDKSVITSKRIELLEDLVENLESKLRHSPSMHLESNVLDYYKSKLSMSSSIRDSGCKLSITNDDSIISDGVSNSTLPIGQTQSVKDIFQRFKLNSTMNRESLNISDVGRFNLSELPDGYDESIVRSTSNSSKNDSDINMSLRKTIIVHREVQATTVEDKFTNFAVQTEDIQRRLNIREVERLRKMLSTLGEDSHEEKCRINEYENQVSSQMEELQRLSEQRNEMTKKYHELVEIVDRESSEYKKRIHELTAKLKDREESEIRTSKCLEEFLERCSKLERQLSIVHGQLERSTVKCITEHVPTIEKLEKEVFAKNLKVNEMEIKLVETEKDLSRVSALHEKVNEFESILEKSRQEKDDLRRQLHERLENQLHLEWKLKKFFVKLQERETEITSFKAETSNIMYTNMSNSQKVKELNKEIAEMIQAINSIKKNLLQSEELRRNVEKSSKEEIATLKLRLTAFEENTAFLNVIQESHKQGGIERLKSQLREKEYEMNLLRKEKNETIEKYKTLVKQLHSEIEKQGKRTGGDKYARGCKMTSYCLNKGFPVEKSAASPTTLSLPQKHSPRIAELSTSRNNIKSTDCIHPITVVGDKENMNDQ